MSDLTPKGTRPEVPGLGKPGPSPVSPVLPLGVDPALGPSTSDLSSTRQGTDAPNHIRRDSHARDPSSKRFTKYGGKR